MKVGFWVAPEGGDQALQMMAIGNEDDEIAGRTGTGTNSFLASACAEEIVARCPASSKLLPEIATALEAQQADQAGHLFDLTDFGAEEKELIDQVLGAGEVSGIVSLTDGVIAQIQESVMPGLWRVRFTSSAGQLVGDYLEVASIPGVVIKAAALTADAIHWDEAAMPDGIMNVMPILTEISERMKAFKPGDPSHTISFTLLPMSEADMTVLQRTVGDGPVRLISKGYGACRVLATGARHVWSVQFFNSMDIIILDTLEIGDVPMAARAAKEDFMDSAERLRQIYEAYFV
jgi:hydrogenase-1 operon protein HyaF